jgi:hypothetical protein
MIHRIIGSFFGPAWRSDMKKLLITTAVGLCLAAPAFAQTAADQKGLVTVNLQDVLNNLSADLKVDRANIPVTAQIPINAAANVCGVSVNVLSQQAAGGSPSCSAKTGSQDLTQAVQQQMAAGGNTGNQSGTTAAVNQAAPSSASAPATSAAAPANSAAAPAAAGTAQTAQTPPNAQQLNAQNPSAQTPSAAASQPNAAATRTQPAASAAQQQPAASTAQQQPAAASTAQQQPAAATAQQQPAASGAQQPATSVASQPAAPAQQPAQNAQAPAQQNIGAAQGSSAAPAAQQTAAANDPQFQVKISEAIGQQNIKPVDVSFSITQGAAVPASVSLRPLPDKVLTIAPQYKGYSYFATKEKIVIVEPSKHTVVAVMPMAGPSRAAAPASTKQSVKFSKEQQDVIRKRVVTTKKPTTTGSSSTRLSVEQRVPDSVQLEEFSDEVVREVPTVKSYRYYRQDDGLAVIDPGERRVIEIIR